MVGESARAQGAVPRRGGPGPRTRRRVVAAVAGVAALLAIADAKPVPGPDVHRPDADCRFCHTADAAALHADSTLARTALVPDLEARCLRCHGGEGPSHPTGMRPGRPVPPELPLSRDGLVTCSTCHWLHGEGERARDYERIDNRRGRLCLSCHTLKELQ